MRLEVGKTYRNHAGEKRGPLRPYDINNDNPFTDGAHTYRRDGKWGGNYGAAPHDLDLIAEWTDGPVRTVTRREIVRGQYADVDVGEQLEIPDCDNPDVPPMRKVAVAYAGFRSSAELKAAAAVLLELAGALSDGE